MNSILNALAGLERIFEILIKNLKKMQAQQSLYMLKRQGWHDN